MQSLPTSKTPIIRLILAKRLLGDNQDKERMKLFDDINTTKNGKLSLHEIYTCNSTSFIQMILF